MFRLIAITGGIGSGKSIVSKVLSTIGYPVYDTDTQAKRIMDTDPELRTRLAETFGADVLLPSSINRPLLSQIVFSDPEKLALLNSIVHGAVRADLTEWADAQRTAGRERAFVETAILYQSHLDRMVSEVWDVTAPRELRIQRVERRNGLPRTQIEARIDSQDSFVPASPHPRVHTIINDGLSPILPRIEQLLES